ncbi:MAG: hypothetical protein ABIY90_13100 [Puia sp.]
MNPVIGRDIHDMIIPPNPAPVPGPYLWIQILSGIFWPSVKMAPTVFSGGFPVIQRGSDIGSFIVHVGNPANISLPFIILGSASKSEFGSFSVKAENKPVATAFPMFIAGLNLTCQGPSVGPLGPFPCPFGGVISFGTQFAGMSWGDVFASVIIGLVDMLIQGIVNKLGSFLGSQVGKLFFSEGTVILSVFVGQLRSGNAVGNFVSMLLSDFVIGSPLGYSSSHLGADDVYASKTRTPLGGFVGDKEDAFFDWAAAPSPDADELPPPSDPSGMDAGVPSGNQPNDNTTPDGGAGTNTGSDEPNSSSTDSPVNNYCSGVETF